MCLFCSNLPCLSATACSCWKILGCFVLCWTLQYLCLVALPCLSLQGQWAYGCACLVHWDAMCSLFWGVACCNYCLFLWLCEDKKVCKLCAFDMIIIDLPSWDANPLLVRTRKHAHTHMHTRLYLFQVCHFQWRVNFGEAIKYSADFW